MGQDIEAADSVRLSGRFGRALAGQPVSGTVGPPGGLGRVLAGAGSALHRDELPEAATALVLFRMPMLHCYGPSDPQCEELDRQQLS